MPEKRKTKQVIVRLDPELVKRAKKIAVDQERPLTEVIEELLKDWTSDQEKEAKYQEAK